MVWRDGCLGGMRNFYRLAEGMNVAPVMQAIARQPDLWNANDLRTTFAGTPHSAADDILLRFNDPASGVHIGDDLEAVTLPVFYALPVRQIVFDIMRAVEAERLGRVMITRLVPGARIEPHRDVLGVYATYYTRYHVALQSLPGALFRCGAETVNMRTGDVWWFDASAEHELANNSADDRVHLLIDVRVNQCR